MLTHLPSLRLRWSSTHWLTGQAVKVDELSNTLSEVENETLVYTVTDSLAEFAIEILGYTLPKVGLTLADRLEAEKVDTLSETSHEYEAKAQDDTLCESIPVVEIATLVDSVAKVEDVALITQWSTSQTVEINVLDEGRGPNVHTLASRDRARDTLLTRFTR